MGQAVRYQDMIMHFIALAAFGAIILQVRAISIVGLDPHTQLLQTDQFEKMPEDGVSFWSLVKSSMLLSLWTSRGMDKAISPLHQDLPVLDKDYPQKIQISPLKEALGDSTTSDEGSCNDLESVDAAVCSNGAL